MSSYLLDDLIRLLNGKSEPGKGLLEQSDLKIKKLNKNKNFYLKGI